MADATLYRFIHLSDIHFGQERDGTLVAHTDVREELLSDCAAMRKRLSAKVNGILLTGDTVYAGKRDEYKNAGEWLDRLTKAVDCARTAVMLIPGNHDVDLAGIDYNAKLLHDTLRTQTPNDIQATLEGLARSPGEHPLHRKLKAYREFAEQYGCDFESPTRPLWQRDLVMGDGHILRLMGLTSVQVSDKRDAKDQMVLGNTQFTIPRNPNIEYVVLLHHPLEWYRDRTQAEDHLHSRARVLMFGHDHVGGISKTTGENNHEFLVINSGATNPPEGGEYRFTYNWIEFSVSTRDGAYSLSVRVYPRVWVKGRTEFCADSTRMQLDNNESKEFVLACTQFQAPPPEPPVAQVNLPVPAGSVETEGDASMANDEEEQFARLRYFFWRYLDWRQRLKVLVEADILPDTADRPVSQTMERLALNSARTQVKLSMVWDAVMKAVPEDKREQNPFGTANKRD